jgi:hypothetical protein
MATIGGLNVGLALDSATFIRETQRINASVNQMGRNLETQSTLMTKGFAAATAATNQLRTAVVGLVAGLGIRELAAFTQQAFKAVGDLGELAQQAGVTARQLQVLQFAAVSTGLAQESIGKGLAQFGKRLGEAAVGTGALKDLLKQYDIELKNADGSTRASFDALGDLAEAVQNAKTQTEQLRIVTTAFGRSGAEWIPLLSQGREGLEAFATAAERAGLILGPEFIKKADDAVDAVAALQFAVTKGFQVGLIEGFNVKLGDTAEQMRKAAEAGRQFGELMAGVLNMIEPFMTQLSAELEDINWAFGLLQQGAHAVGDALGYAAPKAEELRQKLAELEVTRGALAEQAISFGEKPESMLAVQEADRQIEAINKQIDAQDKLSAAHKPLQVEIHKSVEETGQFTKATQELTGAQKRLAEAGRILTQTSAQEERFSKAAEETARRLAWHREEALKMTHEAHAEVARQQSDTQKVLTTPFSNALEDIQSEFTDTFALMTRGGIRTFEDIADAATGIFANLSANMASLAIFDPAGFKDLATEISKTSGGLVSAQGATGILGAGAFAPPLIGAGLGLFGSNKAAQGFGTGSGLGAGAGALAGSFLGPGGAALGAALGGLGGGGLGAILGGIFGGGSKSSKASIGGGALGTGAGSGLAAQLSAGVDKQISGLLTVTQEGIANQFLKAAESVKITFDKKKGLSEGDIARITAARLGPVAQSLGFNAAASADIGSFQEAIGAKKAVDDLRGALHPFATQVNTLREQLDEAYYTAAKYGIALEGVAEAQNLAYAELDRQQRSQFITVAQSVGASSDLDAALGQLQIQMESNIAAAQQLGIPLDNVSATLEKQRQAVIASFQAQQDSTQQLAEATQKRRLEIHAIMESVGAMGALGRQLADLDAQTNLAATAAERAGISTANLARLHQLAADDIVQNWRLRLHEAMVTVGAMGSLGKQLGDLDAQMRLARNEAERLGISLANLARAQQLAADDILQNWRLAAHAIGEAVGVWTPLERALGDLDAQMKLARNQAERLGLSTANLTQIQQEATQAIIRQHQAQQDALALSIVDPFQQLLEPLHSFRSELTAGLLNPLQQAEAAAANFRSIANLASGGNTDAIRQVVEAGQAFIQSASATGASPATVRATEEVQGVVERLSTQIATAQAEASHGVENAIATASQREVDTLRELIDAARDQIAELKRITRSIS